MSLKKTVIPLTPGFVSVQLSFVPVFFQPMCLLSMAALSISLKALVVSSFTCMCLGTDFAEFVESLG